MKPRVTKSSGNVYVDLGLDPQEAENRRVRAVLMMEIERYINQHRMKQAEAAKYFGVKQPEISHLLNRNIDRFSIDKLVNMVSQIGKEIQIKIQPAKAQNISADSKYDRASTHQRNRIVGGREMAKKTVNFNQTGISKLPDDKPVVYKIQTGSGSINYAGVAQRGRVRERLEEHLPSGKDYVPGSKVQIEQMKSISGARQKEGGIISRSQPKYNKRGK